MQPSRITQRSATLIDNIFINDLELHSLGGNITNHYIWSSFLNFAKLTYLIRPQNNAVLSLEEVIKFSTEMNLLTSYKK